MQPAGLIVIALVIAFIPTVYNLTTSGRMQVLGYATNINVGDLAALGNQERANAGQPALSLNSALSQAAYAKAQDMFANNYWAHNSPSGATPWMFIANSGYSYSTTGENLAKNFSSSAGVMYGWMNSPTHRANVLGSQYQDVGYAVLNGVLQGEETTLVVAMYGAPQSSTPPPAPAAAATETPTPPKAAEPVKVETPAPVTTETPTTETSAPVKEAATPAAAQDSKTTQAAVIADEETLSGFFPAFRRSSTPGLPTYLQTQTCPSAASTFELVVAITAVTNRGQPQLFPPTMNASSSRS